MTEEFDDFEKRLRAALRAEADDIPVSHDALERIRSRTEHRRLFPWSGLVWLRPVVAVGAAALIAGSVLLGTPQIRDHVLPGSFVSASDTQRADEESPPAPAQEPGGQEGAAAPPVRDAPSLLPSPLPEASPSAPEPTGEAADSEPSSSCASASPREQGRDAAPEEDGDRSDAPPCPSPESPSAEPEPGPESSSPPAEDGSEEGPSSLPDTSAPGEAPSSPPALPEDGTAQ